MTAYTAKYDVADIVDEYEGHVVDAHIRERDGKMRLYVDVDVPLLTRCADCHCWYPPGAERVEHHAPKCPIRAMLEYQQ